MEVENNQKTPMKVAASRVGYANILRYQTRAKSLFNNIQLTGTQVLDVGCGSGAWSLWAALHGAERVVAIEPEAHGSTSNSLEVLQQTIKLLGLENKIQTSESVLQELAEPEGSFDVVVMYNVINHLDEEAVGCVHREPSAFERYVSHLSHLRRMVKQGGWLIVADCARANFWNQLGFKSPLATSIEWHKHQNPEVWTRVMERAGFRCQDLQWSPLQPFPSLTSNWLVQYLTSSHFVLRCRAV